LITKVSKQNTPQYEWGDGCEGWRLKKDGDFTVIFETMPPDTSEKNHFHKIAEQFFYCLEGSLSIECNNEKQVISNNEGLIIPAGTPHKVRNVSNGIARFLVVSCPDSQEDRIDLE
jgi:mannose-6-phosphate isomerase-like protein (cupin superfamily)